MEDDLDRFRKFGISETQIQVLRWFRKEQGTIPPNSILRGKKGISQVPAGDGITLPHYKIGPRKAEYVPQGQNFVQSIVVSKEESTSGGYSEEVKFDAAGRWYQVDYVHKETGQYKEIQKLENCYDKKVPIAIIHKLKKGVNKILGLGIIKEKSKQCKAYECNLHNTAPYPTGRCKHFLNYKLEPYDKQKLSTISEEKAVAKITRQIEKKDYSSKGKETTVRARQFSAYFKNQLMIQYDSKCAFCNISSKPYLVGAHIVPKKHMDGWEPKNAMNPKDGLLLCKLCDIAFEHGHITVNDKYQISISKNLVQKSNEKTNKVLKYWIKNIQKKIPVKKNSQFAPAKKYLKKKIQLVAKQKVAP